MALTGAYPTFTFFAVSHLKFSLEKSSVETFCISCLALGPATTNTPVLFVKSSKITDPSSGIHF